MKTQTEIPKWMRKYIQDALILQEKAKGGTKGRPKFFSFKEGEITLYYLKYVKGYGREKIYRLLNKLAQKMKLTSEGEEYVSEKTIQRRLEEIDKKKEEIRKAYEELRKKHEEERTKEKIVYREEILNELENYINDVKEGKEKLDVEHLNDLIQKISDFEGIRFYTKRWVNTELQQGELKKGNTVSKKNYMTVLKMSKKLYDFMVQQKKKPNPRDWDFNDVQDFVLYLQSEGYKSDTYRNITLWIKMFPVTQDMLLKLKGFQKGLKTIGSKKTSTHILYVEEFKKAFDDMKFCNEYKNEYEQCQKFKLLLELHLTTMAREGTQTKNSSLFGIKWSDLNEVERTIRVFERKTQKYWEGIDIDLLFPNLIEELKKYRKEGDEYIVRDSLGFDYKDYTKWLKRLGKWLQKIEERTFKGKKVKVTLSPHDIRRSGAYWRINYLNLPLEAISGFKGGDRFYSPMGVGWEDPNTLVGFYASPTARLKSILQKARTLSQKLVEDPERIREEAMKEFSF